MTVIENFFPLNIQPPNKKLTTRKQKKERKAKNASRNERTETVGSILFKQKAD